MVMPRHDIEIFKMIEQFAEASSKELPSPARMLKFTQALHDAYPAYSVKDLRDKLRDAFRERDLRWYRMDVNEVAADRSVVK